MINRSSGCVLTVSLQALRIANNEENYNSIAKSVTGLVSCTALHSSSTS
jgi:hypothetical protein